MNSLAQDLSRRALDIIRDPSSWTQSASASVPPKQGSFCGFGALARAAHERALLDGLLSDIFGPGALTKYFPKPCRVLCLHDLGDGTYAKFNSFVASS